MSYSSWKRIFPKIWNPFVSQIVSGEPWFRPFQVGCSWSGEHHRADLRKSSCGSMGHSTDIQRFILILQTEGHKRSLCSSMRFCTEKYIWLERCRVTETSRHLVQDSTQLENPFAFQQLCGMRCNAPAMTRSGECYGSKTRCLTLLGALVGPLLPWPRFTSSCLIGSIQICIYLYILTMNYLQCH